MSKHLVVRVDIVELDDDYGDLPASYDDAEATYSAPIPSGDTIGDVEQEIERMINAIDGG